MKTPEQIIEIIRTYKSACEEAASAFDDIESSPNLRHLPLQTVQRKQYAIAAQIALLQQILERIESES